jgi:hypothetical protein
MAVNWDVAEQALAKLPPLLQDDDLTVKRFYEAHKDVLNSVSEARHFLDALVDSQQYVKVTCRSRAAMGNVIAYRPISPDVHTHSHKPPSRVGKKG